LKCERANLKHGGSLLRMDVKMKFILLKFTT
jgi:hypothetical protein